MKSKADNSVANHALRLHCLDQRNLTLVLGRSVLHFDCHRFNSEFQKLSRHGKMQIVKDGGWTFRLKHRVLRFRTVAAPAPVQRHHHVRLNIACQHLMTAGVRGLLASRRPILLQDVSDPALWFRTAPSRCGKCCLHRPQIWPHKAGMLMKSKAGFGE
jgi:hypothetical protein